MEKYITAIKNWANRLYPQKDKFWTGIWFLVLLFVALWNWLFLNRPAFRQIGHGFLNTSLIAFLVTVFSLVAAWLVTVILNFLNNLRIRFFYFSFVFFLNLIRSVPQIIGILFGYIGITYLIALGRLNDSAAIIVITALVMALFIFLEIVDLMRERIDHFKNVDFYSAMKVCGISESRIINFDILWKNSRLHIFNKLIAVFGMAVFLQCSVDFIISVGLSTEVSAVNLPTTLGSLLAKIDSKQDILAIGNTLFNPAYFPKIFYEHLQGVTVAFLIVFTLLSLYKISNGYAERNRL